mmetsp:Transcript_21588/g.65954  ORF Transcript_21588/g.65954 Transcript_21588/m.65954 type:complete len:252 (-) Transcript_21588:268-1023(-)
MVPDLRDLDIAGERLAPRLRRRHAAAPAQRRSAPLRLLRPLLPRRAECEFRGGCGWRLRLRLRRRGVSGVSGVGAEVHEVSRRNLGQVHLRPGGVVRAAEDIDVVVNGLLRRQQRAHARRRLVLAGGLDGEVGAGHGGVRLGATVADADALVELVVLLLAVVRLKVVFPAIREPRHRVAPGRRGLLAAAHAAAVHHQVALLAVALHDGAARAHGLQGALVVGVNEVEGAGAADAGLAAARDLNAHAVAHIH